jgi:hypothetical protein
MLAHVLALSVGLGSFSLYMSAFFFPEVYRKYDLTWSGVGMFYALVLWVCAGRITGGVLLGQMASVALIGWLGWQTLSLRREMTPPKQKTPLPGSADSLAEAIQIKTQEWKSDLPRKIRTIPLPGGLNRSLAKAADSITSSWVKLRERMPSESDSTLTSVATKDSGQMATAALGDRLQNLVRRITGSRHSKGARSPRQSTTTAPTNADVQREINGSSDIDLSFDDDDEEPIDAEFEPILSAEPSRLSTQSDNAAHEDSFASDAIAPKNKSQTDGDDSEAADSFNEAVSDESNGTHSTSDQFSQASSIDDHPPNRSGAIAPPDSQADDPSTSARESN